MDIPYIDTRLFFFYFLLWDKLIFLFTPFQSVVHRPQKPHQVSEVTSAGKPRHLCHVVMLLHEDEYEPLKHVKVKNKSKHVSYKIMPLTVSIHLLNTLKLKSNLWRLCCEATQILRGCGISTGFSINMGCEETASEHCFFCYTELSRQYFLQCCYVCFEIWK